MSFRIVEGAGRTFWVATDGASAYVMGQLVTYIAAAKAAINGTVKPLAVPAGVADTTNFQIIAGIVVGFNNRSLTYSSTYKAESETGVVSQANQLARDWMGQEGMYSKTDPQMLVQICEITPNTVIEGSIFNAAIGTAPTLLTVSASTDSDGMISANVTTNACEFTPVANKCTIYCRTGANAGIYRVTGDTSTTAPQVTTGFPYDVVANDTFVRVPLKQGYSNVYISGPGIYINSALGLITNTFEIIVYKLNLSTSGKECAQFRFANMHFDAARA